MHNRSLVQKVLVFQSMFEKDEELAQGFIPVDLKKQPSQIWLLKSLAQRHSAEAGEATSAVRFASWKSTHEIQV
jgi:hypothetical protein